MQARAASRTWQAGDHVIKLARDEPAHFTAGLRASEAAGQAGIATPVRTRAGELCVALPPGRESWVLAVLHRVDGNHLSMHAVAPAVLGELLGSCTASCAAPGRPWTPGSGSVAGSWRLCVARLPA